MTSIKQRFLFTTIALIVVAAACLTYFYREVTAQALIHHTRADNKVLAFEMARSLSPGLEEYLAAVQTQTSGPRPRLSKSLAQKIGHLETRGNVKKITVFDTRGKVDYSTDTNEIGSDREQDAGVRAALAGRTADEFKFKDALSGLGSASAGDNVVQTFIPVVDRTQGSIVGGFEVSSSTNDLVVQLQRAELNVMLGGIVGFALLAVALIAAFRRAGNIMDSEQKALERARHQLSSLSLNMLSSSEKARRKIAGDLESGIVQSLSAVKLSIESAIAKANKGRLSPDDPSLESVIPVMHEVIEGLSSLAAELHPLSVQELGLLPAIDGMCREIPRTYPSITLNSAIQVAEGEIPAHLKITIYSTASAVLKQLGSDGVAANCDLSLTTVKGKLCLRIKARRAGKAGEQPWLANKQPLVSGAMEQALERVALSRGKFSIRYDMDGGIEVVATWAIDQGVASAPDAQAQVAPHTRRPVANF